MLFLLQTAFAIDVTVNVVLDPDGDGDLTDAIPIEGVDVVGYLDLADGQPSGIDDLPLMFGTTSADGSVLLTGVDGTWWFAVDSEDIAPSPAWAEQTYGSRAVFCADGAGGTLQRGSDGPCFGGRSTASDVQLLNVGLAEHIGEASGSGSVELTFGFATNVVTHTRDSDDAGSSDRFSQGSLRQLLLDAQVLGAQNGRFTPILAPNAVGTSGSWWEVEPAAPLPAAVGVELSGTAWCNGISCALGEQRDTNVGPELEISGSDAQWPLGSGTTLDGLALHRVPLAVDGTGIEVRDSLLGPKADGTTPTAQAQPGVQVLDGASAVTLADNWIEVDATGIQVDDADTVTMQGNLCPTSTGLCIDLDGDGVTPNDGLTGSGANQGADAPIFTGASLSGQTLSLSGHVGLASAPLTGPFDIEVFLAEDDGDNGGEAEIGDGQDVAHGEPVGVIGSCTSTAAGTFSCELPVPAGLQPMAVGDAITGTATRGGRTSELGPNRTVQQGTPAGALDALIDDLVAWTNDAYGETVVTQASSTARLRPSVLQAELQALLDALDAGGCPQSSLEAVGGAYQIRAGTLSHVSSLDDPGSTPPFALRGGTVGGGLFAGALSDSLSAGEPLFSDYTSGRLAGRRDDGGFVAGSFVRTQGARGVYLALTGTCPSAPATALDSWYPGDLSGW